MTWDFFLYFSDYFCSIYSSITSVPFLVSILILPFLSFIFFVFFPLYAFTVTMSIFYSVSNLILAWSFCSFIFPGFFSSECYCFSFCFLRFSFLNNSVDFVCLFILFCYFNWVWDWLNFLNVLNFVFPKFGKFLHIISSNTFPAGCFLLFYKLHLWHLC